MKERENFIDIAKGIGIILVILGHLNTNGQDSRNIIYSFHMPLFFILSGIFVNTNVAFKQYIKKSFRRIYCPFLIFAAIDTILKLLYGIMAESEFIAEIPSHFLSLIGFNFILANRPLWFLFVLFVVQIVYYFVDKRKSLKIIFLFAGLLFVLGKNWVRYPQFCLWLVALPCLSFYIIGNLFKNFILSLNKSVKTHPVRYLFLSAVLVILFVAGAIHNISVDMSMLVYGNWFLFVFNALAGSFVLLVFSILLSKSSLFSKGLIFYGRNSIVPLVSHYYICRIILPRVMAYFNLSKYLYSATTQIIVLILVLGLMIPIIWFSNTYLWFAFGKRASVIRNKKMTPGSFS